MSIKKYSSLNELYDSYKDSEIGKMKYIENNIIWKIGEDVVINIDQNKYSMNAVVEDKYLIKLLKDDKFFYKDEPDKYYKDVENLINKFIKGEKNNTFNFVKKYCWSLYNKKRKKSIIISFIIFIGILLVCYSILFR